MMSPNENSLKGTWSSIFLRKGGEGVYTRLFDNLDVSHKIVIEKAVSFHTDELPIVGSVRSQSNWLVLTTDRLIYSIEGQRTELLVGTIADAVADFTEVIAKNKTKAEMNKLKLLTLDRKEHLIEMEPGRPLSGIWNVLKNIGHRNRNRS